MQINLNNTQEKCAKRQQKSPVLMPVILFVPLRINV